ncbi:F-box/LRR-repeat protein 25-like isoform X2 [Syzygium oleosum]|uniref:F-box/LRR-repeat protein 25-like isoform X2 n=1 Tax=Syzygium oleosum TaxID=219896 RepID=UPI0024BA0129|nr:F-box/LRR-repeat protein 25-like isoform X2 [Syzygium oleosum]
MAGTEDYVSLLPDDAIEHIFSFLPTRDAVRTCVLSRRWRSAWTTAVPDLGFSVSSHGGGDGGSFVDRVLALYGRSKVRKFHLDIMAKHFCRSKIDSWVRFAIDHGVEELRVDLNTWWPYYPLSPSLYNCSSLTRLFLRGCRFTSCESVSWSSLKSLSVGSVSDDVLRKILMGSPVLECLALKGCRGLKRIHSSSLRELVIDDAVAKSPLHISTPRLLSLRVRGHCCFGAIGIVEAPSLVEAELDFDGPIKYDFNGPTKSDFRLLKEILCKLQNATRILFGSWCFRVMRPLKVEDVQVSLPNCKSLTLHMLICEFSFPAIANMLATTPNLEKLIIIFKPYDLFWNSSNLYSCNVDHESYWHMKKKFKRWARHLKNVEIFGFYDCLRFKYEEVLMLVV